MSWTSAARRAVGLGILVVSLFATTAAPAADPSPGIVDFSMVPSTSQAGGHPDVSIHLEWNESESGTCAARCLTARTIGTHFPTGFIGNPHVAPKCSLTDFNRGACPSDSQIGTATVVFGLVIPLYNMETRPDQAGLAAFLVPLVNTPAFLELSGRTDSDYGLDVLGTPIPQLIGLEEISFELWGVPADASHDVWRFKTPLEGGGCVPPDPSCDAFTGAEATVPSAPFLQNPIQCAVPLKASADVAYYEGSVVHAETPWPAMTGCNQLSFDPSLTLKPTTTHADTASGVDVDLKVPQTQSPTTPAPSEIRANRVTLPAGFSINPNAADGKVACRDADTAIGTLLGATCPEFSKVGTLELDVAALPAPIPGALYLGEPRSGDRYRIVLTADGFGTHLKLIGSVRAHPVTGQLTVTFDDLPQQTLQGVDLHFFGSERGLLATPTQCGTYPVHSEFVPWNSALPNQTSTSYFTLDSGPGGAPCPGGPRPFAPRMSAGVANNTAGMHAPFALTVNRSDGEQNLTGLTVKTPPGFTGTLKGIPYCPEAAITKLTVFSYTGLSEQLSPACPPASQIGTAVAGAGAGTHPLYVAGKAYLAGPYKGAPLSLLVSIPAVSGPYDLGTVAVRAALHVDQNTAQITTVSDSLPQILEGVPLRTRFVQVSLDRPNFALNPTNCDPFAVQSTIAGSEGATSSPAAHFQVANCAELPYEPKLALKMTGSTKRNGHPALSTTLTAKPGEANTGLAQVLLPHSQFLDTAHINAPCTRVQFAADACPQGSIVGTATVHTPLLEEPLQGTAYLRSSSNELPDLVVDLRGRFHVVLVGRVDSVKARIRTTFETPPDVPVDSFALRFFGGKRGLLVNSENLCKAPQKALVRLQGQNNLQTKANTTIHNPCAKARKRAKAKRAKHRRQRPNQTRRAIR